MGDIVGGGEYDFVGDEVLVFEIVECSLVFDCEYVAVAV